MIHQTYPTAYTEKDKPAGFQLHPRLAPSSTPTSTASTPTPILLRLARDIAVRGTAEPSIRACHRASYTGMQMQFIGSMPNYAPAG